MNTEEYNHIKTLEEAKQIIAKQDMIIGHQFRQITDLESSQRSRNEWLYKAKQDAGYNPVTPTPAWTVVLNKKKSMKSLCSLVFPLLKSKSSEKYE